MSPAALGIVASSNVLGGGTSPLTVIETHQTTLGANGPQSVTFTSTPVAGDKVIVAYACHRTTSIRVISSISGMGGTWTGKYLPASAVSLWVGNNVSTSGTVTITQNAAAAMTARLWLVRGLTSDTTTGNFYGTGSNDGLPHTVGLTSAKGQMSIHWVMGVDASLGPMSFPTPQNPSSGWVDHAPASNATVYFASSYRLSTETPSVTHSCTSQGDLGDGMHSGAATVGTAV